MYKNYFQALILLIFLVMSLTVQADENTDVGDWAQKTLIDTLSADYLNNTEEHVTIYNKYSPEAWDPIRMFFHEEHDIIKKNDISLHPIPLTIPNVRKLTHCPGINQCWRVSQSFRVLELKMDLAFSLLIVRVNPVTESPFLIQSINMKMRKF